VHAEPWVPQRLADVDPLILGPRQAPLDEINALEGHVWPWTIVVLDLRIAHGIGNLLQPRGLDDLGVLKEREPLAKQPSRNTKVHNG